MWSPTHVQVTVQRARGLISKGKNGTNNVFVTIGLGKETFQTSVKDKATEAVDWHEKCELLIPKQGNTAEIVLTALHHNLIGIDEFLGRVCLPLNEMDVYERPKNRWFKLKDKAGKETKERGELEVKVAFIVKAGSLSDLSKKEKHRSSLGQLSHAAQSFGGSLISIGSLDKRKGLKKFASKISHKLNKKSHKSNDSTNVDEFKSSQQNVQSAGDADPGVISEAESDDDFMLDELSHKGSGCSLSARSLSRKSVELPESPKPITDQIRPPKPPRIQNILSLSNSNVLTTNDQDVAFNKKAKDPERLMERIIIGKEVTRASSPQFGLNSEILKKYSDKSKEDLIYIIMELQERLSKEQKRQRELEDYLDQLLLRVMETSPRILQNPYSSAEVA
ncbi:hypothetical protein O3M35_004602 [Rhynocoris fuscipes]|uniref:Rab11 family-interacting protein 1 n=1 Tax=Rhynocoris fuscipes TaxID=488301 RepID=A0AAW1CG14_9HEMI